jgi:ribose transport system substrate-binding protein
MQRRGFLKRAALTGAGIAATSTGFGALQSTVQALAASERRGLNSLKFIAIMKTVNAPYWQWLFGAAKHAAADLGVTGLAYTGPDSQTNIAGQVALVENVVTQKPDFLILAPTNKTATNAAIDRVYSAGIKVILVDSSAGTTSYQSFLSTDNHAAGLLCADALAASIKAKTGSVSGQVAYGTFISGGGSLQDRDQGFLDGLKKYPGLQIVSHKDAGGDATTKPISMAVDLVTAFPNLVGYFADNQQVFEGAVTAFNEKDVDQKKVTVVGFDASPVLVSALKSGRVDGILLQNPWMMGYGGVCYGVLAALGVQTPKFLDTGAIVASRSNMNSAFIQGLLGTTGPQMGL